MDCVGAASPPTKCAAPSPIALWPLSSRRDARAYRARNSLAGAHQARMKALCRGGRDDRATGRAYLYRLALASQWLTIWTMERLLYLYAIAYQ